MFLKLNSALDLKLFYVLLILFIGGSGNLCAQFETTTKTQPEFQPQLLISEDNSDSSKVVDQWVSPSFDELFRPITSLNSTGIARSRTSKLPAPKYKGPLTDRVQISNGREANAGALTPKLLEPIVPRTDLVTRQVLEPALRAPIAEPAQLRQPVIADNLVRPASYLSELSTETRLQENEPNSDQINGAGENGDNENKVAPKPDATLAFDDVSIEDLTRRIKEQTELVNNDTTEEETKKEQLKQLNLANSWITKANQSQALIDSQSVAQNSFDKTLAEFEEKLKQELKPELPGVFMTADELQTRLQKINSELQNRQAELDAIEDKSAKRDERTRKIPMERTEDQERLDQLKIELEQLAKQPEGVSKELSILNLQSEELARKLEIEALNIEVPRQEQIGRLLPKEREWINRNIQKLQVESKAWAAAYNDTREREILYQTTEARSLIAETRGDAELNTWALAIDSHVKKRNEWTSEMKDVPLRVKAAEAKLIELDNGLQTLRAETESKITREIGMSLVERRNQLALPAESLSRIEAIKTRLQEIRQEKWQEEQKKGSEFPDQVIATLVASNEAALSPINPLKFSKQIEFEAEQNKRNKALFAYKALATRVVNTRTEYLAALNTDFEDYRAELLKEEQALGKLVKKIKETAKLIDEKALWVQSTKMIGYEDLHQSRHGLESLLKGKHWSDFFGKIKSQIASQPLRWAFGFVVIVSLFAISRRLKVSHD